MQNLARNRKKYTKKQIICYAIAGVVLGLSVTIGKMAPKIFHQKWIQLGSAYDVEDEFFYSNLIRHAREYLYLSGVSSDNFLQITLKDWQKYQVDKAFTKIPETDGERTLWTLDLDVERWYKMYTKTHIPEIMPLQLKSFDELTSMPMASRWARETERFERADRIAGFFFLTSQESGLSEIELDKWRWKIVRRMNELVPNLDKQAFLKLPTLESHITPLQWEDTIFVGTAHLLLPPNTHTIRCNKESINIFLQSKKRILALLDFYKTIIFDHFGLQWIDRVNNDVNGNAEDLLHQHCPTFIK